MIWEGEKYKWQDSSKNEVNDGLDVWWKSDVIKDDILRNQITNVECSSNDTCYQENHHWTDRSEG